MIADTAGLDPTRSREACSDHAAHGSTPWRCAKQRRRIHRFKGQFLLFGRQQRLNLMQGRPGANRQHQLVRLVQGDAIQRGQIEHGIGRTGVPDRPLGAVADDIKRLI